MIRNEISDMRTQISDPLNRERHRTASNTRTNTYNCAGYALECFSWYCPRHGESSWRDYEFDSMEEAIEKTQMAVDTMLEDFPDLRVVQSLRKCGRMSMLSCSAFLLMEISITSNVTVRTIGDTRWEVVMPLGLCLLSIFLTSGATAMMGLLLSWQKGDIRHEGTM